MTGVYTENQPDFSWLKPFEEKVFIQYFMPYKKVGAVKNASIYAAVNLELTETGAKIVVYATEEYADAEKHFRAAIKRLTWRSPNPYDSEPYYNLGLVLFYQDRKEEAYDAFYKAAWKNAQQEMSYYYLACIACGDGEYEHALELVERSLVKNSHQRAG